MKKSFSLRGKLVPEIFYYYGVTDASLWMFLPYVQALRVKAVLARDVINFEYTKDLVSRDLKRVTACKQAEEFNIKLILEHKMKHSPSDVVIGLEKWRKDRGMDKQSFDSYNQAGRLLEECSEFIIKEPIDAACDLQVFAINAMASFGQPIMLIDVRQTTNEYRVTPNIWDIVDKVSTLGRGYPETDAFNLLMDIASDSARMVEHLGYHNYECMMEAIKEISCRKQDPEQAKEWAVTGPVGKWKKDANQDPATLYKANYDKCKKSLNQNPDETSLSEDVFGSGEDLDSILGEG